MINASTTVTELSHSELSHSELSASGAASQVQAPSAFAAAEIQLNEFIDLEQYPVHDLQSPLRAALLEHCRAGLESVGCAHVPNFIRPQAIAKMQREASNLMDFARPADSEINPYLTADDPTLAVDHPKRFFEQRTSSFINSNHLEPQSMLRKIYDCDVLVHFFAQCLNQGPIYSWADPLARNPYSVMNDNDYFPWHFDGNEFTVSMLVQEADSGGDFEYVPNLRNPNDERFDEVAKVLHNQDRSQVQSLSLKCGDLQLFKGRYSMHRVTKTQGQPRIIALPTYVTDPYLVNRPYHAKAFYGESLAIHHEREMQRMDNLTD